MLAERVVQWADDWKREGLQEGRQVGLQEGRQEGQAKLLMRLLERRFGVLTPAHVQQIEQAAEVQLEAWVDVVLTAQSLDEVFAAH